MLRGRAFWGSLFILAGGLFLLNNLGLLPVSLGGLFWPLMLVLVGLWVLLRGSLGGTRLESESVSLARENETAVRLRLQHGAGRISIRGGAGAAELLRGEFTGGVDQSVRRQGSTAEVRLSVPSTRWLDMPFASAGGIEWQIELAEQLDYEIEMETGAGENLLNLKSLKVRDLHLKTGASSTVVHLPERVEQGSVKVEAGMASVELHVPESVAARITSESGLAEVDVNPGRFPRSGSAYESPDFAQAERKLEIHLQTGLASTKVL
jgi:hypothetical protein